MTEKRNGNDGHQSSFLADDSKKLPTPFSENEIMNFINQQETPQLIPTIIDHHASHNPQKVFASIPMDNNDLSQGFRDITYFELREAVDKAAYWLEEKLGSADNEAKPSLEVQQKEETSRSSFPTFAFYGTRDLRYSIFAVAAMKTGYKVREFVAI